MSRFSYAQDNRTIEQFKKDFDLGKKMQYKVMDYLQKQGYEIEDLSEGEVFGEEIKNYLPDFKMNNKYIEFKYVDYDIKDSWLKENQAWTLKKYNGYYMQVKKTINGFMYNFLHIDEILKNELIIGYGGKKVYQIKNSVWKIFKYKLI